MTNLEIIISTEAFKTYIEDPDDLYVDARSLDKWQLVKNELLEKRYNVLEVYTWDLYTSWLHDTINDLPQFIKVVT